jgi:proton-dependent oligopeptide transporter, POT family
LKQNKKGALISDGYIGKYKTLVLFSFVYLISEVIITLTSFKPLGAPSLPGSSIGFALLALASGGFYIH